ncbi:MAG: hypothetical protein PHX80_05270 [Candidatus Nanoarchaeia archaeon]|nr:hypothetical protein [Candidatus Nanoarchaeia archaeon]
MGKAIYQPKGKAQEYSKWACNFYTGCSNNCDYCYCKHGVMGTNWSVKPHLKKCFRNEGHAIDTFVCEMFKNKSELQKHGLFFSFTTDPMLHETISLTEIASRFCLDNEIPVKILTKTTWWINALPFKFPHGYNIGFTLTGHDELESHSSPNESRIEAMKKLHIAGFKTWASIEPIINLTSSYEMIIKSKSYCDHYKIGLKSGSAHYDKYQVKEFIYAVLGLLNDKPIYFKDSLLATAGINRNDLPYFCVTRDFNLLN